MTPTATPKEQGNTTETTLFMRFELSEKNWKLGFTTGPGQKPRERTVTARDQQRVLDEIAQAKHRFGLLETAPVVRCDEAGREGFWLHRFVEAHGVTNHAVDSSAIAVSRRQRRAKSDGLDVRKVLSMLMRYAQGERQVWQVVTVPSVEAEDQRHLHRDVETLKRERASTTARMKGLRSSQGLQVRSLTKLPVQLETLRRWDGSPLPPGLRQRVLRVSAHHQLLSEQIAEGEAERRTVLHDATDASIDKMRQLMMLKGMGINGSWLVVREFFGWRAFKNRREVGGLAGFTPTPYQSGESAREQGISKSGNRHVRWMTTELAWSWLRYQPDSALRVWCRERVGSGGKRLRRMGIVAVARKLLIALWRFLETGVLPEGGVRKEGETLKRCEVPPRPGCWWRRPDAFPGLPSKPSSRWGRLLRAFRSRRKTPTASGAGRGSPHGEKVVGDDRSPRQRKPPANRGEGTHQESEEAASGKRSCVMTSRTHRHSEGENQRGGTPRAPAARHQRRQEALQRYLAGEPIAVICREMGCAKSWWYPWRKRHQCTEPHWVQEHSRRPRTSLTKTPSALEAEIVRLHQALSPEDAGTVSADVIRDSLRRHGGTWIPSRRTISRILQRQAKEVNAHGVPSSV